MARTYLPLMTGRAGEKAEWRVMTALQGAFSGHGEAEIHAQFPVRGPFLRVPDVLLLDRELGLVVIEVKGIYAAQIESVAGDCWRVRGYFDQAQIRPYQQASAALSLLTQAAGWPAPRHRIAVALPNVSVREWMERGFRPSPEILLRDHLEAGLVERLRAIPPAASAAWDEERWRAWRAWLGGDRTRETPPAPHKGTVVRQLDEYVAGRHRQLRGEALEMPRGVYRLRGIAGSGKTTLLAQSAAWMLFSNPDARIGFVYHSRSLFDLCFGLVLESLERFAAQRGVRVLVQRETGKIALEGGAGAIRIFNSWGGAGSCGFYTFLCSQLGVKAQDLSAVRTEFHRRFRGMEEGSNLLPLACRNLLEHEGERIEPYFDALLIDEAQDLIAAHDGVRWEGREPFFWLAYRALHPVDPAQPAQRRLVFAYDEAQSLSTLRIPSARQVFGEDLARLFVGGRNRVMRCSFRNPKPILLAAHALGMGLLRPGGALQGLSAEEWRSIGYEVTGEFRERRLVTLLRTDEHSPNPVPRLSSGEMITLTEYDSPDAELRGLRALVMRDVAEQGLRPERDILVVNLRPRRRADWAAWQKIFEQPAAAGFRLRCFIPGILGNDRNEFWRAGAVTVTDIWRAKGNEAPMVYIVGLDALSEREDGRAALIRARNTFFVALTRAQAWVSISGVARDPVAEALFAEVRRVVGAVQSSSSAIQFEWKRDRGYRDLTHEAQPELALEVA